LNFQFSRAARTTLSNTPRGSDDTMLTSVTLPFSSICRRTTTRPLETPARIASRGYCGSSPERRTMPRRIAGLGGAGGATTGGGWITYCSGGGAGVTAVIVGAGVGVWIGMSGGGT
jgi:hypothetical protein